MTSSPLSFLCFALFNEKLQTCLCLCMPIHVAQAWCHALCDASVVVAVHRHNCSLPHDMILYAVLQDTSGQRSGKAHLRMQAMQCHHRTTDI